MPVGYVAALLVTWPSIFVLARRTSRGLMSHVWAALIASVVLAMIFTVALSEPAQYGTVIPGACVVGLVIAFPSVIAYWVLTE